VFASPSLFFKVIVHTLLYTHQCSHGCTPLKLSFYPDYNVNTLYWAYHVSWTYKKIMGLSLTRRKPTQNLIGQIVEPNIRYACVRMVERQYNISSYPKRFFMMILL